MVPETINSAKSRLSPDSALQKTAFVEEILFTAGEVPSAKSPLTPDSPLQKMAFAFPSRRYRSQQARSPHIPPGATPARGSQVWVLQVLGATTMAGPTSANGVQTQTPETAKPGDYPADSLKDGPLGVDEAMIKHVFHYTYISSSNQTQNQGSSECLQNCFNTSPFAPAPAWQTAHCEQVHLRSWNLGFSIHIFYRETHNTARERGVRSMGTLTKFYLKNTCRLKIKRPPASRKPPSLVQ